MKADGRPLVEELHQKTIERPAGQVVPDDEPATVHYSQLPEPVAGDPLFREWNTYRLEVARLLAEGHQARFVLIKEEQIVAICDDEQAAFAQGYERFGRQAFLVHQIQEREQLVRIRGCNLPCPSSTIPLAKPA